MNYPQSQEILEKIKSAKRILINCHTSADVDSVASCLSMYNALLQLEKTSIKMVCSDNSLPDFTFLSDIDKIEIIDPSSFKFDEYDLLLILDSGNWNYATGSKSNPPGNVDLIAIDHHYDNEKFGTLNLIDVDSCSTCEILFSMFQDWNLDFNSNMSNLCLYGIMADTGGLHYKTAGSKSFRTVAKLLEQGADKNQVVYELFRSTDFTVMKFWGKVLNNMEIDEKHGFVWSVISKEDYEEIPNLRKAKSAAAAMFSRIVKNTNFGMIIMENSTNETSVSFRERNGYDVSKIAHELGGGGHKSAAAADIKGIPFREAVDKILEVARKYSI